MGCTRFQIKKLIILIILLITYEFSALSKSTLNIRGLYLPKDIEIPFHPKVIEFLNKIRYDSQWHNFVEQVLNKGLKYEHTFKTIIKRANLPESLFYVAGIESGYNAKALSPAGAYGYWQFTKLTALNYGLRVDRFIDERADPELSTFAATKLLKELYKLFGRWDLVLAAYNMGYGGFTKSLVMNNSDSFWKLLDYEAGLPWETSNYVAKVFALIIVAYNPEQFGIKLDKREPLRYCYKKVESGLSLEKLSLLLKIPKDELIELNPQLRRMITPYSENKYYYLRVPIGEDRIKIKDCDRFSIISWQVEDDKNYEPKSIRWSYNLTPTTKENKIIAVIDRQSLIFPKMNYIYYRVQLGDTLEKIAEKFNKTVEELIYYNNITSNKPIPGMILKIYLKEPIIKYQGVEGVIPDDSIIPVIAGSEAHYNFIAQAKGYKRTYYTVKEGESLKSIAKKFKTKPNQLARINKISVATPLNKGDKLIVYVPLQK